MKTVVFTNPKEIHYGDVKWNNEQIFAVVKNGLPRRIIKVGNDLFMVVNDNITNIDPKTYSGMGEVFYAYGNGCIFNDLVEYQKWYCTKLLSYPSNILNGLNFTHDYEILHDGASLYSYYASVSNEEDVQNADDFMDEKSAIEFILDSMCEYEKVTLPTLCLVLTEMYVSMRDGNID